MAPTMQRRTRPAVAKEVEGKRYTSARMAKGKVETGGDERQEVISRTKFPVDMEPAFVRVAVGRTINLGDFNMLRIDVGVTLPCDPAKIDDTYIEASEFVEERLNEEEDLWIGKDGK